VVARDPQDDACYEELTEKVMAMAGEVVQHNVEIGVLRFAA
jgi:hypothetical protein